MYFNQNAKFEKYNKPFEKSISLKEGYLENLDRQEKNIVNNINKNSNNNINKSSNNNIINYYNNNNNNSNNNSNTNITINSSR